MPTLSVRVVACVAVLVLGAGVCGAIDETSTDGWQYGGYHCGCLGHDCEWTQEQCWSCCEEAVIPSGPLTPGQVERCKDFCDQMGQPCC
ncbi:MAG: hypothetical protein HRU70_09600 [Phycisphaeraceae bacterium]|nr:MAG: hypothetical protein HRU70_09600 [Phycisphaeraceae bacterium]